LKQKQVSESDLLQQVDSLSQKLSKTETEKPSLKSDQSEEETSAIELEKLKKRLRIEAQEV
jgi:regulator of replication initiation timing